MPGSDILHQLHIDIPKDVYDELKTILPERGTITSLIRRLLINYLMCYKAMKPLSRSPGDVVVESAVKKDLERR